MEWISVEEKQPDIIGDYLVFYPGTIAWAFYNSRNEWVEVDIFVTDKVTHWMPLPEPPNN